MGVAVALCSHSDNRHFMAQRSAASATAATTAAPAPPPRPHSRQRGAPRWRAGTRRAAAYTTTTITSGASSSGSGDSIAGPAAVDIAVEPGPSNSRCIWAGVDIVAPAAGVYGALTAYQDLGNFIPGLAENTCLERYPDGCKLLQVGQQDLGLGLRFCARVCLRITEFPGGVPRRMLSRGWSGSPNGGGGTSGGGSTAGAWWPFAGSGAIPGFPGRGSSSSSYSIPSNSSSSSSSSGSEDEQLFSERRYMRPRSPLGGAASMDVAFQALEGDFAVFKGLWRVQAAGPAACRLSYSLFVRPQPWLLVGLIERRIQSEIAANLAAVKAHVER